MHVFYLCLISGRINSPKILPLLDINVPPRSLRNSVFLRIRESRINNSAFKPVKTMSSDFGQSRYNLKKKYQEHHIT